MTAKALSCKKNYLKMIVFFLIIFGFGFLPAPEPLTPYGMKTLGIFIGLVYGWCAIGMIWPSIVGILAMVLLDILPLKTILANGWGSTTMVLIFFMMMISKNLEKAGISNFIALWFISRKIVLGRPWLFSYSFLVAIALISTMTSAVATILLGWAIFYGVADEIKAEKYNPYSTFMVVGIVVAASLGNGLFPFRTVGAVAFALMTQISGEILNNFVYTIWAFAMCFFLLGVYIFLGKYLFKISVDVLKNLNEEYFMQKNMSLNKKQKIMLILMLILIALMLLPSITPTTWLISILFTKIQATGVAALICLAMCLISVDGKPLMEPRSIIQEGVSWDVMFLGAAVLPLANGVFSSEEAGINAFLTQILSPIVADKSSIIFLVLTILISTIITNFVIDVTVPTILFPAFYPVGLAMGVPTVVLMVVIVYACYMALLMPSASPMAAMMFGNADWVRTKDIYKYCGTFIMTATLLCCLCLPVVLLLFS